MKIYLAGPMTGYTDFNFPHFAQMAKTLRDLGHEVTNPAEIDMGPNPTWGDCMRADIAALIQCTGIAMLRGWELSRGASLEHHIAKSLSMQILCAYQLAEAKE